MFVVAFFLAVASGAFYAAGNRQIGQLGDQLGRYGEFFCQQPGWLVLAAVITGVFGLVGRVDRL